MITRSFFSKKEAFLYCLEDIKEQIEAKSQEYDFLIFAIHPSFQINNINNTIKKVFKTDNFIGFHAVDAFINNEIVEEGVGVYLIKFEKKGKINKFYIDEFNESNALKTAEYLNKNKNKFHIIFAAHKDVEVNTFLENVSKNLNYYPVNNIAGGVASGYEVEEELRTMLFTGDKIIKEGIVILSFENVKGEIGISLGHTPYGITYKITKSEGNKVYLIDDGKSFSYIVKKLLRGIENPDNRYLWYVPIYVLTDKNSYISVIRTIKDIKEDFVEFFANIKENHYFKLSFATFEELIAADEKTANKLLKRLNNPELSFNFSCIARQYVLEEHQKDEISIYTKIFDTHLFGFFTFGEIAPDIKYKKLMFYNNTSIPLIMKEI